MSSSLADKYKFPEGHEQSEHIVKMLDLNYAANTVLDWRSTKTFEAFLDALDINQRSAGHHPPNESLKLDTSTTTTTGQTKKDKCNPAIDKISETQVAVDAIAAAICNNPTKTSRPQNNTFHEETILSAEALEILSELPDLSYMSVSRSFIKPNQDSGLSNDRGSRKSHK